MHKIISIPIIKFGKSAQLIADEYAFIIGERKKQLEFNLKEFQILESIFDKNLTVLFTLKCYLEDMRQKQKIDKTDKTDMVKYSPKDENEIKEIGALIKQVLGLDLSISVDQLYVGFKDQLEDSMAHLNKYKIQSKCNNYLNALIKFIEADAEELTNLQFEIRHIKAEKEKITQSQNIVYMFLYNLGVKFQNVFLGRVFK